MCGKLFTTCTTFFWVRLVYGRGPSIGRVLTFSARARCSAVKVGCHRWSQDGWLIHYIVWVPRYKVRVKALFTYLHYLWRALDCFVFCFLASSF